jgi:hypothetical protein
MMIRRVTTAAVLLAAVSACTVDNPAFSPPVPVCATDELYVRQPFILPDPALVDILFVVDNSGDVEGMQSALSDAMPGFVQQLQANAAINWQIGVVSTDVVNDAGELQVGQRGPGCPAASTGLINRATPDAGQRAACAVQLGEDGDDVEQAFFAVREALKPATGFRRDGSSVVVVFVSNEDDCSATVNLDRDDEDSCRTQTDALVPVADFQNFFRSEAVTRAGDQLTFVALIAGTGEADAAVQCGDADEAYPGNRYAALVESIGRRSFVDSVCQNSFDRVLGDVISDVVFASDDVLCVERRMTGQPSLVALRPDPNGEITSELSDFGDYLPLGATDDCAKGAVSINRAAHDASTGHRVEVWFCTDEAQ